MGSHLGSCTLKRLYCTVIVTSLHARVSKEKVHVRLLEKSAVASCSSAPCTCLNHVAYRVERHRINEVVYAGYRIVMLSGHKHDDGLGNMRI